jgi:hypothetical protein
MHVYEVHPRKDKCGFNLIPMRCRLGAVRAIVKSALPVDRANEVFDEMRRVANWIQQKANEVDRA